MPVFFDTGNFSLYLQKIEGIDFYKNHPSLLVPLSILPFIYLIVHSYILRLQNIVHERIILNFKEIVLVVMFLILNIKSSLSTFLISIAILLLPFFYSVFDKIPGRHIRNIEYFFYGTILFVLMHFLHYFSLFEGTPIYFEELGSFFGYKIHQSLVAYPSSMNMTLIFILTKIFVNNNEIKNASVPSSNILLDIFFAIVLAYIIILRKNAPISEALIFFLLKIFMDFYFKRIFGLTLTITISAILIFYFDAHLILIDWYEVLKNIESSNRAEALKIGLSRINLKEIIFGSFSDRNYSGSHNLFIDILYRGGVISLAIFLIIFSIFFKKILNNISVMTCNSERLIIFLSLVLFLIVSSSVNSNLTQIIFIVKLIFVFFYILNKDRKFK